jgi:hypothetical protein
MAEKETWRNPGAGPIYIQVDGPQGVRSERVGPGSSINIETSDRKMNQAITAHPSKDFFTNGRLVPVRLIESAEDYEELSSNPNLIGDNEIKDLLGTRVGFKKAIAEISNVAVLLRLKEFSESDDDVTAAQIRALDARIEEVSPNPVTSVNEISDGNGLVNKFTSQSL